MEATRAEIQFDGMKATFYYQATRYIDLRDLVRALFKHFGTRV
jgi:cell fate regulator YaaT (PSP1 superfamily)